MADSLDKVVAAYKAVCRSQAILAESLAVFFGEAEVRDQDFVGYEVSRELYASRVKGDRLVDWALTLCSRPAVLEALREGRIDEGKARLITDQIQILSEANARIAEATLLDYAPTRAYTTIRRHAQTLIHKLDPTAAQRRHKE